MNRQSKTSLVDTVPLRTLPYPLTNISVLPGGRGWRFEFAERELPSWVLHLANRQLGGWILDDIAPEAAGRVITISRPPASNRFYEARPRA